MRRPFRLSRRRRHHRHKPRQSQMDQRAPLAATQAPLPTRAGLRPYLQPRRWPVPPQPHRRPRRCLPQSLHLNQTVLVRRMCLRTPLLPNRMCWPPPCARRLTWRQLVSRLHCSHFKRTSRSRPISQQSAGPLHQANRVPLTSQACRHRWLRVWRNSPAFPGHQNPTVIPKRMRSRRRKSLALRLQVRRTCRPSEYLRISQCATRCGFDEALLRRGLSRSPDAKDRSRFLQRHACTSTQRLG